MEGPSTIVQAFNNFKSSAAPARFLASHAGHWTDVSSDVFRALYPKFISGNMVVEIEVNGGCFLFDFLRLLKTDVLTGESTFIAWIDVHGRCFFPRPTCEIERVVKRKREERAECSDESDGSSTISGPRWEGATLVREDDRFYKLVEKLFLAGGAGDAVITSVSRCSTFGLRGRDRLQRFQTQLQRVKDVRGDAGLKFAWHGAKAEDVARVVERGFAGTNEALIGDDAHGVGLHLSPPRLPHTSCAISEPDSNGERHVILCRVIMGKSERIPAGSTQFCPSSKQFDSGVDDLVNPKWYIVWDAQKDTHIHPEYIVSFRMKQQDPKNPAKKARGQLVSARELIQEVGKSLPSARKQELDNLLDQLKAAVITTGEFFKSIRFIVGDTALTNFAKKFQGH